MGPILLVMTEESRASKEVVRDVLLDINRARAGLHRTRDGWIYLMCMKEKFWEILAERIDRRDLMNDPRFASQTARRQNRKELTEELDAAMSRKTTQDWLAILGGAIPAAPIYNVDQAFENPFMATTGMVTSVAHPQAPDLKVLASPLKIDGARPPKAACPPLGSGNNRLLDEARSDARSVP